MALSKCGCGSTETPAATLEYNDQLHVLTFQDGQGGVEIMPLNTGTIECLGNGFRYTDERGQVTECTWDDQSGITDLTYDPATHALNYIDANGSAVTLPLNRTQYVYNPATHEVTFTDEAGVMVVADLNVGSLALVGGNLQYTDEHNQITQIPLPCATLGYDETSHRVTLTCADGSIQQVELNTGTLGYDPATNVLTYTDERGLPAQITLGTASYMYNAVTHEVTFTDATGSVTLADLNVGTLSYIQAAHQLRYMDEHGDVTAIDLGLTTASYDPAANTLTIVDQRGVPTAVTLSNTQVAYNAGTHDLAVSVPGEAPAVLDLNTGSIVYDDNSHSITYTDEEGTVTTLTLEQGCIQFDAASRTLTYDRPDGTTCSVFIPDNEGDMVTYDAASGTITITHPDGSTEVITLGGPGAVAYNSTTHTLTFTDDGGNTSTFPLNVGTAAYDATTHTVTYTDERGIVTSLVLDVATIAFDDNTRLLTYEDEQGGMTTMYIPRGDLVAYDAATNTITVTHDDGTTTTIPITPSALTYDPINDVVTHTSGDGTVVTFPVDQLGVDYDGAANTLTLTDRHGNVTTVPVCCPSLDFDPATGLVTWTNGSEIVTFTVAAPDGTGDQVIDNGDGTYTVIKSDGTTFNIDVANTVVTNNGDGSYTATHPDGTTTTWDTSSTTVTDNGDGTFTATNANGTTVTWDTASSSTVDNGDGTYTVTNPDGTTVTWDTSCATTVDNGDGTITTTNCDGTIVTWSTATTDVTDNGDGSFTVTDPDGDAVTITNPDANIETVTGCMVDNTDPANPVISGVAGLTLSTDANTQDLLELIDNGDCTYTIRVRPAVSADAVNDELGNRVVGTALTYIMPVNDTACSQGTMTFALIAGSENNVVVNSINATTGEANITPQGLGAFSFQYELLCDGVAIDNAVVSGTGTTNAAAADDAMGGSQPSTAGSFTLAANDTVCESPMTTTYALVAGSEINVTGVTINATTGVATFTTGVLDGAFSFDYQILCDGAVVDTATASGTIAAVTADAVDDTVGNNPVGTAANTTVATNDTACSEGVTTYALVAGSETNVASVTVNATTGAATFTPQSVGAFSFQYQILCDGVVLDTATVSGTGTTAADAVNDAVGTTSPSTAGTIALAANDTACEAPMTTTYALVAGSEVNVTGVTINATTGAATYTSGAADGAFSFDYQILCDGNVIDTATVSGTVVSVSATAVDDVLGVGDINATRTGNLASNDTACSSGTTTYTLVAGSEVSIGSVSITASTGAFTVTPDITPPNCAWSFDYEIRCDGVVMDTATVSGTCEGEILGAELVTNGDFSATQNATAGPAGSTIAAGWTTPDIPYVGINNTMPGGHVGVPDTTVGIINGTAGGPAPLAILQAPFPGDPAFGVPASNSWIYSNGNDTGGEYISARQAVSGFVAGNTYRLIAYVSNVISAENGWQPSPAGYEESLLQFRLDGVNIGPAFVAWDHSRTSVAGASTIGGVTYPALTNPYDVANFSADGNTDLWRRVEFTWTATASGTMNLDLVNNALTTLGNDLAFTQVSIREVIQCP